MNVLVCISLSLYLPSITNREAQVDLDRVKITKGTPAIYDDTTAKSGKTVHRNFCNKCGCPLWSTPDSMPGKTFVKPGVLDIADQIKLTMEVFCENATPGVLV